jgi:hypothetical protein
MAMTNTDFQNVRQRINNLPRGNSFFNSAVSISRSSCFTSEQARDLANFFTTDRDKLEFLKSIYPNTVDKNNFVDVMDVFKYFSSAFRLYDWIQEFVNNPHFSNPVSSPSSSQGINYPSIQMYNGRIDCQNPLTQNQIMAFKANYGRVRDNNLMAGQILNFSKNNCVTSAQAMELTQFITDESIRLDVLIKLMPNIYDVDNYNFAAQLLPTQSFANIFLMNLTQYQSAGQSSSYVESGNLTNRNHYRNNQSNNCKVSPEEQSAFINSVNSLSFDNDKLSQIKVSMANRCLTPTQVKALMGVSSFEASKLEIAKMLYDNCLDKKNYYLVNDAFLFSGSVRDLNKYISTR